MRNRVSASLRSLLNGGDGGEKKSTNTRMIQSRHLQALNDVGQSRTILYQNIVRCIELWKRIAKRYADKKCIVGYDLLNEPLLARYEGVDVGLLR